MITATDVESMAEDSIVFAMANPEPEIMPELIQGKARVIATGRSDYPNQVNNVLCFPGLFRGALDSGATAITEEMKIVAARAIAGVIPDEQLSEDYILPSVFNEDVSANVALPRQSRAEAVRSGNGARTRLAYLRVAARSLRAHCSHTQSPPGLRRATLCEACAKAASRSAPRSTGSPCM